MRQTEHLGLALYDTTDKMNITGSEDSLNHNMELLDAAVSGQSTAFQDGLESVKQWIYDLSECEFVFGHLSEDCSVTSNGQKNICFKEKIFVRKGSRVFVDQGYKYQIALYQPEDKTPIRRIYWMQSDEVYEFQEDSCIRVEISDVNESVLTDMSISTHLHCELLSNALSIRMEEIRKQALEASNTEIDSFIPGAKINIGSYSIGQTVDMTPGSLPYMRVAVVNCSQGDQFLIHAKGGAGPRVYGFVDGENRLLSLAEAGTAEVLIERRVVAPENAAKLIINDQNSGEKCYLLNALSKSVKDIDRLGKRMEEEAEAVSAQIENGLNQASNLVRALGMDAFRGKTMELSPPNKYAAWPFVCAVSDKLVCVYSRGLAHEDNTTPSIFARVSKNGVIWSGEREIIKTPNTRHTVTGKGNDEDGRMLFWDRTGSPGGGTGAHQLYRTADGYHFELVSSPVFAHGMSHVGDIIQVPDRGLLCFFNDAADSRTWGVLESADNGQSWTQTVVEGEIAGGECPMEISPVYLGDGKILAMGRQNENENGMFQLQSSDYGATWSKAVTNITGVRYITPSLVYNEASGELCLYYYDRGSGSLKMRRAKKSDIWDNPTNWGAASNISTGYATGQDSGNVNACAFGDVQIAAFYSGSETDTGIYAGIV